MCYRGTYSFEEHFEIESSHNITISYFRVSLRHKSGCAKRIVYLYIYIYVCVTSWSYAVEKSVILSNLSTAPTNGKRRFQFLVN